MPPAERLIQIYQEELSWTSARAAWLDDPPAERREAERRVRLMFAAGCRPGRVLEIGAGRGALARALRDRGADVWISEASVPSREALRRQGFAVLDDAAVPAGGFDLVILWGVVEHLAEPHDVIRRAVAGLAPQGHLAVYTEDSGCRVARIARGRWHWLLPPEHVVLYSRAGLRSLVGSHGLEVATEVAVGAQVRSLAITIAGPGRSSRLRQGFRSVRKSVASPAGGGGAGGVRQRLVAAAKRVLDARIPVLAEHRLYVCRFPDATGGGGSVAVRAEGEIAARVVAGGLRGFGVQAAGRVARLLYELVVSRVLGAAGFGVFSLAVSAFDLGRAFAYFGVDHAVVRYVAIHDARGERARIRGVLTWAALLGVGAAVATAAVLVWLAPIIAERVFAMPDLEPGLRFVGIALLPNAVVILIAAAVRARGRVELERALQTVWPPLVLAILVGGAVWVTRSLAAAFYAFTAAYVVCAGIAIWSGRGVFKDLRGVAPELEQGALRAILGFAGSMFLVSFATLLLLESPRLILGHLGTAADVGVFTVAVRLATQLTIFFIAFDSLIAPLFARFSAAGSRAELREAVQTASGSVTALTIPILLLLLAAPDVLMSMFGAEFARGAGVLEVVALGQFFLVLVGPTGRVLQMSGRATLDLINSVGAAAVVTAGAVWLIPGRGAMGAALALVIGVVILNGLRFLQVVALLRIWPVGTASLKSLGAGGLGYLLGIGVRSLTGASGVAEGVVTWAAMIGGYVLGLVLLVGRANLMRMVREVSTR
jgi:O-antigen/teichoic acid export membrane protein